MEYETGDTQVSPPGAWKCCPARSRQVVDQGDNALNTLYRNCSLAVLNCGNELDDGKELLERYSRFDIRVQQRARGIKLDIHGAPASAFVDGA
jgi:hypothetical protein